MPWRIVSGQVFRAMEKQAKTMDIGFVKDSFVKLKNDRYKIEVDQELLDIIGSETLDAVLRKRLKLRALQ